MRNIRYFAITILFACFTLASPETTNVAVGAQYDTTHVYVAPEDFDRFVASLIATFGGTTSKQGVFTVTPTPSSTMSQLVLTPVGTVSVFGGSGSAHHWCGCSGSTVRRSDRKGRHNPVAWRREQSDLLAYDGACLSCADDDPGKPGIRIA